MDTIRRVWTCARAHETVTTVKVVNISTTSISFFMPLRFVLFGVRVRTLNMRAALNNFFKCSNSIVNLDIKNGPPLVSVARGPAAVN